MNLARESVELLGQMAWIFLFEGTRHGLSDRDWMALRFLARANRFSRTPSALASYVGATRGTASYIVNELEKKGYLERTPSSQDKRSVTLSVTPRDNKFLERDPTNVLVDALAALDDVKKINFRDALRQMLDRSDTAQQRRHADSCRRCMFLWEGRPATEGGPSSEFNCRLFRAAIPESEIDLLCASFEHRPQ